MTQISIIAFAIAILLVVIGLFFVMFYKRTTKEIAFVRTGLGGLRICADGAILIVPMLHEYIPVKMNTFRLDVARSANDAVITKDRMRADIAVDFFIRVNPTVEAIAIAAQTLGRRTLNPDNLRDIIEAKLVSAMRSVAAEMTMEELHEQRPQFTQTVLNAVSEDLAKNGLELESVALTALDQSNIIHFREDNLFDAEGKTKLTETVEIRRKERNAIQQDNEIAIQQKNLETQQKILEIERQKEFSRLEQEGQISIQKADQAASVATEEALKHQQAEQSRIDAELKINLGRIQAQQAVETSEIEKKLKIDTAEIDSKKSIQLAEQDKQIAISERSEQESDAMRKADDARVAAVRASEKVETARVTEIAERNKTIEIIQAATAAEKDSVGIKVQAQAEKEVAENQASARMTAANAERDSSLAIADGKKAIFAVEAEGLVAINNAHNLLKNEQILANLRSLVIEKLPEIIAASAKSMEKIDSIKIVQMNGITQGASSGGVVSTTNGSLADQAVNAALQYRVQAPLVDGLLHELGIKGSEVNGLQGILGNPVSTLNPLELIQPTEVQTIPTENQVLETGLEAHQSA